MKISKVEKKEMDTWIDQIVIIWISFMQDIENIERMEA